MALNTLYVGRLDKEKGIDSLIDAFTTLLQDNYDIILHVYGTGQYNNQIQKLSQQYPNNIIYHGWQKKNTILTQRKRMDYCIMPSQFLETFGLTACESLLCWVPVIGNKKWGLVPFINDTLNIQSYPWTTDGEKLTNTLQYLINNHITKDNFTKLIKQAQTSYSKESRYRQIQSFLPLKQTTLLISDYINYNGGGIETHIHDSITILNQHQQNTKLYGHQAPQSTIKKLRNMALSLFNIKDSIIINQKTKKDNIWLIRRHSISRVIGWLPLCSTSTDNQIISHHELGLFHPYPSQTYQISQIPQARSLKILH